MSACSAAPSPRVTPARRGQCALIAGWTASLVAALALIAPRAVHAQCGTQGILDEEIVEASLRTDSLVVHGLQWWMRPTQAPIVLTGAQVSPAGGEAIASPPANGPSESWLDAGPQPDQPYGPGSYVPESPHQRLGRWLGDGFADLFKHPPILDHDLLQPLLRESWLYRPFSAGWFMGVMSGSELIHDWVSQRQGYYFGYRLGWDVDDFWGFETRFGWASVMLADSDRAKAAQIAADDAAGIGRRDPWRLRYNHQRDAGVFVWDVDLLYYPLGDAPLRPYLLVGMGVWDVHFWDRLGEHQFQNRFGLPVAIGWKWRWNENLAWRLELADNMGIAFYKDPDVVHEASLTAAMELRFGGTRKAYWPWNPGKYYW